MKITPMTSEEMNEHNKFIVYLNYLKTISDYLDSNSNKKQTYNEIVSAKDFSTIQSKPKHPDLEKVEKLLRSAWFTEVQLNFNKNNPEYAQFSNHWATVQAYYTIYLALRSLFTAMKLTTRPSHTPTLKQISAELTKHPDLFPLPWRITCSGDPSKSYQFNNLPDGIAIKPISSLTRTANIYDSFGLFLKTTRARQIDDKRILWLDKNKPRKKQPAAERQKMISQIPRTTIFDCLYRLRIRSNYHDVESFLVAIENNESAQQFNYSLRNITDNLLQLIELLLAKHLGLSQYESLVNKFIKKESFNKHSPVDIRRNLIKTVIS